jgi:hypothetical protein
LTHGRSLWCNSRHRAMKLFPDRQTRQQYLDTQAEMAD